MNNHWSKFVISAVVAGFVASQSVKANEPAAGGEEGAKVEKKNECKGKDGCKGKGKHHKKHNKKAVKEAPAAPAEGAPPVEAPKE